MRTTFCAREQFGPTTAMCNVQRTTAVRPKVASILFQFFFLFVSAAVAHTIALLLRCLVVCCARTVVDALAALEPYSSSIPV